ncbi:MAG TPA: hypothetical protein VEA69_12060 [Tepidisphaeraceae bacterium]|nr:hypothetical protein [Tepidisphaeraceae bacterium]
MESAFDELIAATRNLGITVRHARLGGTGGGLAQVKGKRNLFIDLDALPEDQLDQTITAMASVPELETVFLRPELRKLLDEAKAKNP